jgi:hypothetical protein
MYALHTDPNQQLLVEFRALSTRFEKVENEVQVVHDQLDRAIPPHSTLSPSLRGERELARCAKVTFQIRCAA